MWMIPVGILVAFLFLWLFSEISDLNYEINQNKKNESLNWNRANFAVEKAVKLELDLEAAMTLIEEQNQFILKYSEKIESKLAELAKRIECLEKPVFEVKPPKKTVFRGGPYPGVPYWGGIVSPQLTAVEPGTTTLKGGGKIITGTDAKMIEIIDKLNQLCDAYGLAPIEKME